MSNGDCTDTRLKKDVGLLTAFTLVVGMVLGAGAFMKPPAVLGITGDTTTAILAWLIGAFLSMCGGLTMAELGVLYPRTGGVYVFLEELYGKRVSYLYGWMLIFLYGPAILAALAGYFSSVFCLLFSVPENFVTVVAFAVLAFVTFVNAYGVRQAGHVQKLATFCKLVPVFAIAGFGIFKGSGQVLGMTTGMGATAPFSIAIISVLFSYDGWSQVASVAGEMKRPGRILPLAIIGGIIFLSIVYTAINVALFRVLPTDQIVSLGHDASSIAAQKLFGLYGGNLISVGIMISIIGGLNGFTMTLSRVVLAMSDRQQLPGARYLGRVEPDSNTPINALIMLLIVTYFYFVAVDTERLTNITMFSVWIFYILCFVGVFLARVRHPEAPRSYRVPLYPVTPVLAIAGALFIIYGMFTAQPLNAMFAVVLIGLGLPVLRLFCGDRPLYHSLAIGKRSLLLIALLLITGLLFTFSKVLDNRPVLMVATENSNRPVAFEGASGEPTGFAIDLIRILAEKTGHKVQLRPVAFEHLFTAVNSGEADVAVGLITITDERKQLVSFTDSFGRSQLAMFVSDKLTAGSLEELAGRRVLVRRGTVAEAAVTAAGDIDVLPLEGAASIIYTFREGAADAIVEDQSLLTRWTENQNLSGRIVPLGNEAVYGFAYSKHNDVLGKQLNAALAELRQSGELAELCRKWQLDIIAQQPN
ncbi:MAG: amino acid permease [Negativicutes bacterium]|nr:amino acid permease [Negativicutes bacterium]